MYHCPLCGQMVLAGVAHPDYSLLDKEEEEEEEEEENPAPNYVLDHDWEED